MEEYITKNLLYNSVLEPIISYLQKSNFEAHSNSIDTLGLTVENLWKFAINGIESVDKTVVDEVNKFFDTYKNIQAIDKPSPLQWRQFIITLHATLSTIDTYKINLIEQSLSKCQTQLESLENTVIPEYLKTWFKDFCQNICHSVALIQKRVPESESNIIKNYIYLHMIQLTTSLRLAFNMFRQELSHKILFMESRRFLIKRYIYCFDGIKKYLNDDKCAGPSPGFIQWIDTALDMIATIDLHKIDLGHLEKSKSAVEEVLCHAMSMKQISSEEDCKRIKAGIQSVLHEFTQLKTECEKQVKNPSLCNLYIDIVSDKLCSLERKVNTAVLHIALKVFSKPTVPLEKLQHFCEDNNTSILTRSENDLDELVTAFDAHVDCLIQVGLFAIACSRNRSIVAKIRSCLASLESLESELVPALTSLYMEPSTLACLHATLFVQHWRDEVQNLKNAVCFIIDPVAFGQVVYDDYKVNLEEFTDFMIEPTAIFTRNMLMPVYDRLQIYILVAKASISDMKLINSSDIVYRFNRLMDIYIEVGAAITQLIYEQAYSKRILKRMLVLRTMLKRSIRSFSGSATSTPQKSLIHKDSTDSKKAQIQKILYDESIRDLQSRGEQILKDRSILYKTPKESRKVLPVATPNQRTAHKFIANKKTRLSVVRRIQIPSLTLPEPNNSLDLQITQILENVSGLTLAED